MSEPALVEAHRAEIEEILGALRFPDGWRALTDETTIGQLAAMAGWEWRAARDALHAAGIWRGVADNTTGWPVWQVAKEKREQREQDAAFWREQDALLEDTTPMDPAPKDPRGGENYGCWPADRPFPMTAEDCQRVLMGYAAPWRGTVGEWRRWQGHGMELWQGWVVMRR